MRILFLPFLASVLFTGCTPKSDFKLKENAYSFSIDQTTELKLSRRYVGEEPWSITLKKADSKASSVNNAWIVSGAPQTLLDTYADEKFILHFLDTLRSLKPNEEAPKGDLSSYGLNPPRFIAEWSAGIKTFTLQIGETFGQYSQFALFEKDTPVFLIQGSAAQQMLEHVKDWEYFRRKPLTLWEPDDVDMLKINSIELVRAGLDWEQGEKSLGESFSKLFDHAMHLRIRRFIDDASENQELSRQSLKLKPQTITLVDRKNREQQIVWFSRSSKNGTRIFAKNILRGDQWAELFPEAIGVYRKISYRALTHAKSTEVKSDKK